MGETRYVLWTCQEDHEFQAEYEMEFGESGGADSAKRVGEDNDLQMECPECGGDRLTMKRSSEHRFEDVQEVE